MWECFWCRKYGMGADGEKSLTRTAFFVDKIETLLEIQRKKSLTGQAKEKKLAR